MTGGEAVTCLPGPARPPLTPAARPSAGGHPRSTENTWDPRGKAAAMTSGDPYPSPSHISYNEDSRWCQENGHTGLVAGFGCDTCDQLVASDPRFTAVLGTEHTPDGSRVKRPRR